MSMRKTRAKCLEELDYILNTVLDLEDNYVIQLIIGDPARITSIELLLAISKEDLIKYKYIPWKVEAPLSINSIEFALIRSLKGFIWHLNMNSQNIRNNFMKINSIHFDNFVISNK